jgi:hypothetical protein
MAEILLLVLVAFAVSSILAARGDDDAAAPRADAPRAGRDAPVVAQPRAQRSTNATDTVDVDGARLVKRDGRFGFVRNFGLDPKELDELYVYTVAGAIDDLPRPVQDLLEKLHGEGCALGLAITAFLFHGRGLADGEAIYVAVSRASARVPRARAVAFIDRRHAC